MKLGNLLERMRRDYAGEWRIGLFIFLAAATGANFFIKPHTAEYTLDVYPGFWAVFGLLTAVAMVWVMKKVIQPLIKRPEEGDDE